MLVRVRQPIGFPRPLERDRGFWLNLEGDRCFRTVEPRDGSLIFSYKGREVRRLASELTGVTPDPPLSPMPRSNSFAFGTKRNDSGREVQATCLRRREMR